MTSPGQEALREAARLESARIYGQVQREHCSQTVDRVVDEAAEAVRRLQSLAKLGDSEYMTHLRMAT